jgi:hypothetical protein
LLGEEGDLLVEPLQEESEQLGRLSPAVQPHRKSLSISSQAPPAFDPLGAVPSVYEVPGGGASLNPSVSDAELVSPVRDRERRDDGFE